MNFVDNRVIELKTESEITKIAEAGKVLIKAFSKIKSLIKPGINTLTLNNIAESIIRQYNAYPSFLNYGGFPASVCASVNDELVHGIPSENRILKNGDIISIDIGSYLDGFHSDCAKTFCVGQVNSEIKDLLEATQESLNRAIAVVKPNNTIGDIGHAIQSYIKQKQYGLVREYVGHGIGRNLHELPDIPNYGNAKEGVVLQEGMVLAIEPMVNLGSSDVMVDKDGWTVKTKDGKYCAHFEHTVAVTKNGARILT